MNINLVFGRPWSGKTGFLINEMNQSQGLFISFESKEANLRSDILNASCRVMDYESFSLGELSIALDEHPTPIVCIDSFEHIPKSTPLQMILAEVERSNDTTLFISSHLRRNRDRNPALLMECEKYTTRIIEL